MTLSTRSAGRLAAPAFSADPQVEVDAQSLLPWPVVLPERLSVLFNCRQFIRPVLLIASLPLKMLYVEIQRVYDALLTAVDPPQCSCLEHAAFFVGPGPDQPDLINCPLPGGASSASASTVIASVAGVKPSICGESSSDASASRVLCGARSETGKLVYGGLRRPDFNAYANDSSAPTGSERVNFMEAPDPDP